MPTKSDLHFSDIRFKTFCTNLRHLCKFSPIFLWITTHNTGNQHLRVQKNKGKTISEVILFFSCAKIFAGTDLVGGGVGKKTTKKNNNIRVMLEIFSPNRIKVKPNRRGGECLIGQQTCTTHSPPKKIIKNKKNHDLVWEIHFQFCNWSAPVSCRLLTDQLYVEKSTLTWAIQGARSGTTNDTRWHICYGILQRVQTMAM